MRVLITGGDGQLGIELRNQLNNNKYIVTSTNTSILDIADMSKVRKILTSEPYDVVINCAAYTQVDKCEEDIETAYKVNN